jgi:23S rRNA (guanosine2251-2'-O)-methyltransferase
VDEAMRSSGAEVLEVKMARGQSAADRRALRGRCHAADLPFQEVSRGALSDYTRAERHDQGVAARVRLRNVIEIDAFVERGRGRAAREPSRLMALDGVTNSQNVGMVVRSVVGAGLAGLLWPLIGQPWVNGLVVRAAVGAIFECPIVTCETLSIGLASLQAAGFTALGLDAGATASVFEVPPPHRAVYIMGSESVGIGEEIRSMLDERVSIPMAGPLESLNVAVAAGLVAFHAGGLLESAK